MLLADRMSRRVLYAGGAALGIAGWLALVFAPPGWTSLLAFAIAWGTSAGIGAQAFYGLWTAELFATPCRASAQGVRHDRATLGFPEALRNWFCLYENLRVDVPRPLRQHPTMAVRPGLD
jgi:hypothetical protein